MVRAKAAGSSGGTTQSMFLPRIRIAVSASGSADPVFDMEAELCKLVMTMTRLLASNSLAISAIYAGWVLGHGARCWLTSTILPSGSREGEAAAGKVTGC